MKVNVEIDLNKIDYDSINEQIKENIDAMGLDKIYPIEEMFKIGLERKINSFLDDYIGMRYGETEATLRTQELVNNTMAECINENIKKYVDAYLDNLGEEKINDLIVAIFPNVLSQYLYNKIDTFVAGTRSSMYDSFIGHVNSIITQRLRSV